MMRSVKDCAPSLLAHRCGEPAAGVSSALRSSVCWLPRAASWRQTAVADSRIDRRHSSGDRCRGGEHGLRRRAAPRGRARPATSATARPAKVAVRVRSECRPPRSSLACHLPKCHLYEPEAGIFNFCIPPQCINRPPPLPPGRFFPVPVPPAFAQRADCRATRRHTRNVSGSALHMRERPASSASCLRSDFRHGLTSRRSSKAKCPKIRVNLGRVCGQPAVPFKPLLAVGRSRLRASLRSHRATVTARTVLRTLLESATNDPQTAHFEVPVARHLRVPGSILLASFPVHAIDSAVAKEISRGD